MATRSLNAEERRLWGAVMATVRPLRGVAANGTAARPAITVRPELVEGRAPEPAARTQALRQAQHQRKPDTRTATLAPPANTLDGGWDKRLSRGLVAPDASIDLHGHTLASAHAMLDAGLARSIARGDRLILLVTGRPPNSDLRGPESERPHARGAIRAAVADWLGASRHADRIAAVRGAHPRHGGAGALYIVLRRARTPA